MSDLEDLDHEPEPVHLDEDLPSEESMEEELSAPADGPDAGFSAPPMKPLGGVLLKIAIVAVVLAGGGAYFVLSSHQAAPVKQAMLSQSTGKQPLVKNVKIAELPKNAKLASAADPLVWNGSTAPVPYSPPVAPAPAAAIPAPAAIRAIPAAIPPASGQQAASPFAAPSPAPAAPSIVNDMPPPMGQLANAGGGMPSAATMPSAPAGSAMPGMPPPIPSAAPSAAPAQTNTLSPFMSEGIPAPVQKQAVQQPAAPQPAARGWPPQVKNGQPMPSAPVAAVDKMEISKTPATVTPAAESAKVQALEKEIADLKKTISQLQQASVMKEDTVEKAVEKTAEGENAEEPVRAPSKAHHHTAHHKPQRLAAARRTTHHATVAKWVLKAAKPGIAWVAKKGSSDISMVEPGDSLKGIGKVTSITRNSSGYWVVSGTKGRISQ